MYKRHLTAYGQYLAKEQALPQNTSADGNGDAQDFRGTLGGVELVAMVTEEITLADTKSLNIKFQDKDDDGSYGDLGAMPTLTVSSSAGTNVIAVGTILWRFIPPTDVKANTKAVITTDDAAAVGAVSIYPTYLAR